MIFKAHRAKHRILEQLFRCLRRQALPLVPSPGYMPLEIGQFQRELHFPSRDSFTPSNEMRLTLAVPFAHNLGVGKFVYGDLVAPRAAPIRGVSDLAVPTESLPSFCVRLEMHDSLRANLERIQKGDF